MLRKFSLIILLCCLFTSQGLACPQTGAPETTVCEKINQLYNNETNSDLKELEIASLKIFLHPELYHSDTYGNLVISYSDLNSNYANVVGLSDGLQSENSDVYGTYFYLPKSVWTTNSNADEDTLLSSNNKYDFTEKVIRELAGLCKFVEDDTKGMTANEKFDYVTKKINSLFEFDANCNYSRIGDVVINRKMNEFGYAVLFHLFAINAGLNNEFIFDGSNVLVQTDINGIWIKSNPQ